ncbi:protein PSK SIMULATOR 2 isoform X2 [Helianthus annuus]|uniref:protein PSK SIMULATOR 2 isoform X2 n=1 Tax=Helianthus annuus TaxID=4232 RepID=UPI000B8F55D9|nr:protein PSK SIMULATOR 2 isoform X2 [Helianthus annuus]
MSSSTRSSHSPMTDDELFYSLSRELKPSTPARVVKPSYASTFLGKAGSFGFEVLDTLGSSMVELRSYGGFIPDSDLRRFKISMFAFEVANTIVKGFSLMESLTDENIRILLNETFLLEGVQLLVSTDKKELLRIAIADKREEFEIFSREVVRFGDMCKDRQWHNLDRVLLTISYLPNKIPREEAEIVMQGLVNLAQRTSELYHEYHALDRLEQVYRRKLDGVKSLHLHRKGESPMILQSELKHQRKLVRSLIKKSLWSKSMEEVVEKLVDVVTFIHQAIAETFDKYDLPEKEEQGNSYALAPESSFSAAVLAKSDEKNDKKTDITPERLVLMIHGMMGFNNCLQLASHPTCLHPNVRDTLYHGLPASVKAGLRARLQALDPTEVMTMPQIKAEMEKTLHWLVPMATSTTKVHQSFGWVGEWANTGFEFGNNTIRLQTLYHADKHKMDQSILDLIILLHRLICNPANGQLPTSKGLTRLSNGQLQRAKISLEDANLLEEVTEHRMVVLGVSKSQAFETVGKKKRAEVFASNRSMVSLLRKDVK